MHVVTLDMPFHGSEISPNQLKSVNGTLFCMNVRFARTGIQYYLGRELGLMDRANEKIKVYRLPEDVFDKQSMQTFEAVDVTDDHPSGDMVTTDNFLQYARGHLQNIRQDGIYLVGDLAVKESTLISKVNSGKRQVSAGYWCDYEPYKDGYRQVNIVANHLAVVDRGRAGDKVLIRDSEEILDGELLMTYTAEQVAQLLNAQAAKDAAPVAQPSPNDTILSKMLDHLLGKSSKPAKDESEDDDEDMKKKKEAADAALSAQIAKAVSDALDAKLASKNITDEDEEDDEKKEAKDVATAILASLDGDDDEDEEDEKPKANDKAYEAARDALKPLLVDMSPKKQKAAKDALRVKFGKKPTGDAYSKLATQAKDSSADKEIDCDAISAAIRAQNPNYASK